MGIYDGFSDTPRQIRSEGQQIDVAFVRNGDSTGTIKWNIPAPAAGCSVEDQAYDGIVITVSNKPADYIESSPSNGIYYAPDPTFDVDLHTGSKIDVARVVGAFYHDKTTRELTVQNVTDKTPYYVSAYAVDAVGRYHREGSHAYSLPTGSMEYNASEDTPAKHDIGIDLDVIRNGTLTGLNAGTDYSFKIMIGGEQYTVDVEGHDALTYPDLINAINKQFVLLTDAVRKDLNATDQLYFDQATNRLYRWNFDEYIELPVLVNPDDPRFPILGTYWFDGASLFVYESSGWEEVTVFKSSFDPQAPKCNSLWFDETNVWMWDGSKWCKLFKYESTVNPLLPPGMTCDDFWFDETDMVLKRWFSDINGWKEVDVIYSETNPNIIGPGDYWYNSSVDKMYTRVAGGEWNELVNIYYEDRNEAGEFNGTSVAGIYWYIPEEQLLYRRNTANTNWIELEYVRAASDPAIRGGCDIWWNSSPSIDDLYKWDELNSVWVPAGSFIVGETDPSGPPEIEENSVWYNPVTGIMQILVSPDCKFKDVEYIKYPSDPTKLGYGHGWIDLDENLKISDGLGGWIEVVALVSPTDPYMVNVGTYWYDLTNHVLSQWNGTTWETSDTIPEMIYPEVGVLILNDVDEQLYAWNGSTWIKANAIAGAILINPNKPNEKNRIRFYTSGTGCTQSIYLIIEAGNLFTQLSTTVMYFEPIDGNSRLERGQTWRTLGIGDDGSPDERRELHTIIRRRLGAPSQKVELTDDQIDEALDAALGMIRKYSGYGYHRNFFFLDLKPNQQHYILTDKCVGFNKVTSVTYMYRMRSGFLTGMGRGSADVYGYAALLHLYRTGTFDMLSYHLVSSYIEEMQILFADHLTFNWHEDTRQLHLYHTVYDNERVLLDAYTERTEQDLFTNRETREWIKRWAVAESKMMLSQIRGKFQTLPGPSGSTTLNSQELITQGETEKADLLQELEDRSMQNLEEAGQGATFIMG